MDDAPDFPGNGVSAFQGRCAQLGLALSDSGFVTECDMQVSARVLGFVEQRGPAKEEHRYGPLSPYSTRELTRFFETTGVCWFFPRGVGLSEAVAGRILEAFCLHCGIQERDLGLGRFHAKQSPLGDVVIQGVCVFDATTGSLRLTQRLAEDFAAIVAVATILARSHGESAVARELEHLQLEAAELRRVSTGPGVAAPDSAEAESDWVTVIADGERGMLHALDGAREVRVRTYRYTPRGAMYELEPLPGMTDWIVNATTVQPIHGETRQVRRNLVTGATRDVTD